MGSSLSRAPDTAPQRAGSSSPASRSAASDVRATILALQRTAGNRAVAGLVGRRRLQRSSTDEDIAQQRVDDVEAVEHLLETGRSQLVDAVPDPGEEVPAQMELSEPDVVADAAPAIGPATADAPVTSPFTFPSWPASFTFPSSSSYTFTFTTSQAPFAFTPSAPSVSAPPPQPEPGGMKRTGGSALEDDRPRKRFRNNTWAPRTMLVQQPILATWPAGRRRLQRKNPQVGTFKHGTAGGAFTWRPAKTGSATKTRANYVASPGLTSNATTLATGLHTHGDVTASTGTTRATATQMKVKRWIIVKGTKTVKNVRPAGWDRFQALCGFVDRQHQCVYIQGHLLYERLGGRGNRMANLSPFTTSLNKRHQNQVEKPLWEWLNASPGGEERTVDYKVVPTYGGAGPPAVVTRATQYFQDFVDQRNAKALSTLVKLGLLDAADVAAVANQPRAANVNLSTPKTAATTWNALCAATEQEIADYIAAAFPNQIDCYARLYKRTSSTADWDKTVERHHTLTNHH